MKNPINMHPLTPAQRAIQTLSQDSLSHTDMLEPIRRGMAKILYAEEDGVILLERNSGTCMIAMQDIDKCRTLIDFCEYQLFSVHNTAIADMLLDTGRLSTRLETLQAVYMKKEPLAGGFEGIRPLTLDYVNQVNRVYTLIDDKGYIEALINRGQLWGLFDHGVLAGFVGEHLEGSMGLLEVLPEYRRKGYGYLLEAFLINHTLQNGCVPFCQIKTDNTASLTLQEKLGLTIATQKIIWVY